MNAYYLNEFRILFVWSHLSHHSYSVRTSDWIPHVSSAVVCVVETANDNSHRGTRLWHNYTFSWFQRMGLGWWDGQSHARHYTLCCLFLHHSPGTMGILTSSLCQLLCPHWEPTEIFEMQKLPRSPMGLTSCHTGMVRLFKAHNFSPSPAPALWRVVTNLRLSILNCASTFVSSKTFSGECEGLRRMDCPRACLHLAALHLTPWLWNSRHFGSFVCLGQYVTFSLG